MEVPKIPNNSLTEEIKEIVRLGEELKGRQYFEFSPAATEDEISVWETTNAIIIPQGYKDWLMFSNGSIIHGALAEFYSLNRIKISGMPEYSVVIGNVTGDGEMLCFLRKTGQFFTFYHGEVNEFRNFKEILLSLIDDIDGLN